MLWTALEDPDPVLIFEHGALYNVEGELASDAGCGRHRACRRAPRRFRRLDHHVRRHAAARDGRGRRARTTGLDAEVLDLRVLRPLDTAAVLDTVRKTHRAVVVDEGWRSGSISAEVSARIMEEAFFDLDAPVARVCSAEVPMPYAKHLEDAALPGRRPHRRRGAEGPRRRWVSSGCPRSAPTWTRAPSRNGWCIPATRVRRGDIVAVVDTDKADVDVEIFENGVIEEILVPAGERVAVGTPLAVVRPAVPAEDGAVPATAAPAPAPPAPTLRRRPRHRCPVRRGAGPGGDSFAGAASLGPPPRASTSTPSPGPDRGARSRGPTSKPQRTVPRPGAGRGRAGGRARAIDNARDARRHRASHGALQAGDTALLPRHRRRLLAQPRLARTDQRRAPGRRASASRCCSSSRRSRAASVEYPEFNGFWVDDHFVAGARRCTSASRSRCAAVGSSRRALHDAAREDPRRPHARSARSRRAHRVPVGSGAPRCPTRRSR